MTPQNKKTPRVVKLWAVTINGRWQFLNKTLSLYRKNRRRLALEVTKYGQKVRWYPKGEAQGIPVVVTPILKGSPNNQEPNPPLPMKNPKKFRARKGKGRR